MTQQLIKEQREEFDKKFKDGLPSMKIHNVGPNSWIEHIELKSFLTSAITTSLLKFIDQEIERKQKQRITKKSHPFTANFAPLEGRVKGFNECVDEDITHLKSLKEELTR